MVDSVLRCTAFRRFVRTLLCGALLAACAAHADDMQEANALLKAGRYPAALEHVNKVIAAKPQDPQARFLKGLILTEQGDATDAIEVFRKLTQDYPDLPEPYNNLAVIYAGQGHYEKARAALEKSIRTHSSYATAYENLGDVYARLASQAYDKALQLDSSNSTAQSKLMLVRSLVGATPQLSVPAASKIAKPVEVAAVPPAPPPVPAPKPAVDSRSEVLAAVEAWASAWSSQDVDAYLAHYAPNFKTPRGETRTAWEKLRRSRIAGPKSIAVEMKSPKVTLESDAAARVTFHQAYRSDRFSGTSDKTLEMVKIDGRWLIREERVGS
ncbi:MAG: tetratricopeptide repeat protein [Burkholderiales bacterium]